jgi:hypothetical protein
VTDVVIAAPAAVGAVSSWSVDEDAQPLSLADSSGSVGSAKVSAVNVDAARFAVTHDVTIDTGLGVWAGSVVGLTAAGVGVSLDAEGALAFLNQTIDAPIIYQSQTLSEVLQVYVDLCDPGRTVVWDASEDPVVSVRPWTDKCWVKVKEMCAVFGLRVRASGSQVVVEDAVAGTLELGTSTPVTLTVGQMFAARQVEIVHQNYVPNAAGSSALWQSVGESRFRVDVGGAITVDALMSNYAVLGALSVGLPGDWVVEDSTGAAVPYATWLAAGGGLSAVAVESQLIRLTLWAPEAELPGYTGPFTYSKVTLYGPGLLVDPVAVSMATGAPADVQERGPRLDSPFVDTVAQAYTVGAQAADQVAGPAVEIRFDVPASVLNGFGLDVGRRVTYRESLFRVSKVTYRRLTCSVTAVRAVTWGDWYGVLGSGKTGADFAVVWGAYSGADFKVAPLREV